MRTSFLIGSFVVAFSTLISTAQEQDRRSPQKDTRQSKSRARNQQQARERDIAQFLKKYDKNDDGVLEQDELPAALKGRFARLDTNKDGKLSKSELRRLSVRGGQRAGEINTRPARGERHADRLKVGEPFARASSGPVPVFDRLLGQAGFGVVVGQ